MQLHINRCLHVKIHFGIFKNALKPCTHAHMCRCSNFTACKDGLQHNM